MSTSTEACGLDIWTYKHLAFLMTTALRTRGKHFLNTLRGKGQSLTLLMMVLIKDYHSTLAEVECYATSLSEVLRIAPDMLDKKLADSMNVLGNTVAEGLTNAVLGQARVRPTSLPGESDSCFFLIKSGNALTVDTVLVL